jgi:hypothetical protein
MANGDIALQRGIIGAGQAIGRGIQIGAQRRQQRAFQQQQQQLQAFQQQMKIVNQDFKFAAQFKDPAVKTFFFNRGAQRHNTLFPKEPMPMIEGFDNQVSSALNDFATIDQLLNKGEIDANQARKLRMDVISAASERGADVPEAKFLQEQVFGAGPVQERLVGNQLQLGRFTPTNQFVTVQPVTPTQPTAPGQPQHVTIPPRPLPAETAGRASSAVLGVKNIDDALNILFPEGKADPLARFTAAFPAAFPRSEGKRANELVRAAIEAKLRADTGATARIEEIDELLRQFGVQFFKDKPEQTLDKLLRLKFVLENSLFRMDPQGKFKVVPLNQQTLQQSGQQRTQQPPPTITSQEQKRLQELREKARK